VRDLIALADLVFLPSTEEGYGLPLLEALLLRTPVLCSDIPSFRGIADGYARFFDVNAPLEEIACLAGEITSSPAASRRREALWSMPAYERAILDLLPEAPEPSLAADS
jgi:glycosyltransferase involved in cell wall biosynthesis